MSGHYITFMLRPETTFHAKAQASESYTIASVSLDGSASSYNVQGRADDIRRMAAALAEAADKADAITALSVAL